MSPALPPPPSGYSLESLPPPPSGYSVEQAKPEQSFGAALQEFGRKMNPVPMAQGLAETVAHPIEAAKSYGAANQRILSDAEDAFKRGDYAQAARHALGYVLNGIPGLGAALEEAGNKMEQGDYAGGLADTAALGSQVAIGAKGPAIAEAVPAVATAAKGAAIGGLKAGIEPVRYGHFRLPVPAAAAGAAAGHYVGRMVGAPELGAAAGAAYPVVQGAIQGAKEALAARGVAGATTSEATAAGAAAGATKTPGQLLAESDGKDWAKVPKPEKQLYEQLAPQLQARAAANAAEQSAPGPAAPRPPEYYGVKAAEVPPTNPAPSSAPAAQPPTSAATPANVQPIRPTEVPTAAPTAAAAAKSARYADAIGKWARDHGMSVGQIADQWPNASAETRGQILLEMKRKGYLEAWETIPKTSAAGIADALKARAATIKPPPGFSLGSMRNQ